MRTPQSDKINTTQAEAAQEGTQEGQQATTQDKPKKERKPREPRLPLWTVLGLVELDLLQLITVAVIPGPVVSLETRDFDADVRFARFAHQVLAADPDAAEVEAQKFIDAWCEANLPASEVKAARAKAARKAKTQSRKAA